MDRDKFRITDLICLECGNIFSISRRRDNLKKVSHIKDMWCYNCMNVTKHYEVVDVSKFMWQETEDETMLYVKELIENGRCKSKSRTNKLLKKIP